MKKTYQTLAIILFGLISLSFIHAFDSVNLVNASQGEVEFNIRFYDRRVYYVTDGNTASDPIYVQVTITNNSPFPYRFKLADDRAFTMNIDIRTMTNRRLPEADSLIRKRTTYNQIFFREITIESKESFSFIENLRDYVRFEHPGSYRVRAFVYPELIRNTSVNPIESNYLSLTLRPAVILGQDGIPIQMDIATGAALVKQPLPPDEVVTYMLIARQQSHWERFMLYLDPKAMLLEDAHLNRRFQSENEAGRLAMIAEYIQNLRNAFINDDISVIPRSFEILRTEYNNDKGIVSVMQKFRRSNYTELRLYRYYLEKRDNFWIIVHYTAQGMGTEE
ncbi:MAG: hypothetical protein FWB86_03295 [Treponema sp.]|nr:hypothetical protein [Treponema sp.]MCL2251182.1 hypothetical protein [Treponema sp.]